MSPALSEKTTSILFFFLFLISFIPTALIYLRRSLGASLRTFGYCSVWGEESQSHYCTTSSAGSPVITALAGTHALAVLRGNLSSWTHSESFLPGRWNRIMQIMNGGVSAGRWRRGEGGVSVFCKCFEVYLCVSEMNLTENTWKLVLLFLKHWLFQAAALPKVINHIFINKGGGTVTSNNRGKQLKLHSFEGPLCKISSGQHMLLLTCVWSALSLWDILGLLHRTRAGLGPRLCLA